MSKIPDSLERVFNQNPTLRHKVRGLPNLGLRADGEEYSPEIKKYMLLSLFMVMIFIS